MKLDIMTESIATPLSRAEYEDFLYNEAALLDRHCFDEWLTLFTPDAIYEVPQAGAQNTADSAEELFYIADDYKRLCYRVTRMKSTANHSEWPASVSTRLISNVRIIGADERGVQVESRFITYRSKNDMTDLYCGHHQYILRQVDGQIRIASKRSFIDMNSLRQQGKVSIVP